MEIPESFYCPITHEVMVDPVIDPDGNSYERQAIENWLSHNAQSPITRNPLTIKDLRPNRALQDSIDLIRGQLQNTKAKPKEQQKKKKK